MPRASREPRYSSLRVAWVGLEDHLKLGVPLHAVRVVAVTRVVGANGGLGVAHAPGLGAKRAKESGRVHRARANLGVVGKPQRATFAAPVLLETEMASWNVGPVAGAAGVLDAVEASVDVAASVEMARFTRTMRREAFQRPVQRPGSRAGSQSPPTSGRATWLPASCSRRRARAPRGWRRRARPSRSTAPRRQSRAAWWLYFAQRCAAEARHRAVAPRARSPATQPTLSRTAVSRDNALALFPPTSLSAKK